MKVLSRVAVVVGVLVLATGVGVGIWGSWIAYWHYATLSTGRSAEFENPIVQISLAGLMLGLGGFLAGLGLGRPRVDAKATDTKRAEPKATDPKSGQTKATNTRAEPPSL